MIKKIKTKVDKPCCIKDRKGRIQSRVEKKYRGEKTRKDNKRDTKKKRPLGVDTIKIQTEDKSEGDIMDNYRDTAKLGLPKNPKLEMLNKTCGFWKA